MPTYYELLGVPPTASGDEIRAAYARERARCLSEERDDMDSALNELDQAYAALSEPGGRATYDRSLQLNAQPSVLAVPGKGVPPLLPTALPAAQPAPVLQIPCPHCGAQNSLQATVCQECGGQVSRPCPNCNQTLALGQAVCPRCQTVVAEYDQRRYAQSLTVERRVQHERGETEIRREAADTVYRARVRMGFIFWTVVVALSIGLSFFALMFSNYLNR